MNIQDLRKELHLSVSSVNTYIDCGLLYKLSRLDRLKPEFSADSLELGSVVHDVIAEFNQEKMIGNKLSLKELQALFEEYWAEAAEENEEILYSKANDYDSLLKQGRELIKLYHQAFSVKQFSILAIEQPFRFKIEGLDPAMIGVFDLIEEDPTGAIIIVDLKTSGRSYAANDVDKNFQMTVYQMAAKACGYGEREILLRFDCLIKTKTPKFEQYYTTRSELDEKRAVKKITEVWRGINNGIFVPNDTSWRCNGCAYKSYCDDWFEKEEACTS